MTTETISGKCPCCGYDKLIQRYGSHGWWQVDGCVRCGFGYGFSPNQEHEDDERPGFHHFRDFAIHSLSLGIPSDTLKSLPDLELRRIMFECIDKGARYDDVEGTIFIYPEHIVAAYRATNPVVFDRAGRQRG